MSLLHLKPACKDYIWGGHRLVEEYHVDYDGPVCAEAWMLSCHPDGPSVIENGPYAGRTLPEYFQEAGMEEMGTHCRRFREFPILVKFIDARENLSIQVHPGNRFALSHEGQYGKTEMWYVLDAEPGAFLYYGFRKEISKEEFQERIRNGTLPEVLNAVPVQKGDALFIESGTIHAIGKGILIAEIQQNSNVTYRVYDYGRVGKDGRKRDLQIEKALAVTNRIPIIRRGSSYPHVADCDYFTVDRLSLDGDLTYRMQGRVTRESFLSILILDGEGSLSCGQERLPYRKGDSFLLTADSGDWQIEGRCNALLTTIREKAQPIRVGVIIGSLEVQMGLLDDQNNLLVKESYPTPRRTSPKGIVDEAAKKILSLLSRNHVPLDQCVGVGVGVPGTIDRRRGRVLYSNNLAWESVDLTERLQKVIPCPVRIANDADCAALGEAACGAGKDASDVVLLTLGNGVGGGIILGGQIFEGGMMGGSEVGHQVIRAGGRLCTCGRRGCLEAYVSLPALLSAAKETAGRDVPVEEIFSLAEAGDPGMCRVLSEYTRALGEGIVNVVNLYRPQLVLLGGILGPYMEKLLPQLRKIAEKECFGGVHGEIPSISCGKLGKNAGIIGASFL